jgi:hypothetical protein
LRDFVPPLLLRRRPDFFNTAILAAERPILVVTAQDKIRNAVTGGGPQPGGRDGFSAYRAVYRSSIEAADLDLPFSATESVRLYFLTALLVAFHGWSVMSPGFLTFRDDFASIVLMSCHQAKTG